MGKTHQINSHKIQTTLEILSKISGGGLHAWPSSNIKYNSNREGKKSKNYNDTANTNET